MPGTQLERTPVPHIEHQMQPMTPGHRFSLGEQFIIDSTNSLVPGDIAVNNQGTEIISQINFEAHPDIRLYVVPLGTVRDFLDASKNERITDRQAHELYKGSDEIRPWDSEADHRGRVPVDGYPYQLIVKKVVEEPTSDGERRVKRGVDLFRIAVDPRDATGQVIITERVFQPEEISNISFPSLTRHATVRFSEDPTVAIGENTILFPRTLKLEEGVTLGIFFAVDREKGHTMLSIERSNQAETHLNVAGIAVITPNEQPAIDFFEPGNTLLQGPIQPDRQYVIFDARGCSLMKFSIDKNGNMIGIEGTEEGAQVPDGQGFRRQFSLEKMVRGRHITERSDASTQNSKVESLRVKRENLEQQLARIAESIANPTFVNRKGKVMYRSPENIRQLQEEKAGLIYDINEVDFQLAGGRRKELPNYVPPEKKAVVAHGKGPLVSELEAIVAQEPFVPKLETKTIHSDPWLQKPEKPKNPHIKQIKAVYSENAFGPFKPFHPDTSITLAKT